MGEAVIFCLISMESQPLNTEFRIHAPEKVHPCSGGRKTSDIKMLNVALAYLIFVCLWFTIPVNSYRCSVNLTTFFS